MVTYLKKFGTTLISRQLGKEAYSAFRPTLNSIKSGAKVEIDFAGVNTLSPAWGDEFLTPLEKEYNQRLVLKKSDNLSVLATIKILEQVNNFAFNIK